MFDRYWVVRMVFSKTGWLMTALATGGDQTLNLPRWVLLWASISFVQILSVLLEAFNLSHGLLEYLLHEQLVFLGCVYFISLLWLKRKLPTYFKMETPVSLLTPVRMDEKPLDVVASSFMLRHMHHLNSFCSHDGDSGTAAYGTDALVSLPCF